MIDWMQIKVSAYKRGMRCESEVEFTPRRSQFDPALISKIKGTLLKVVADLDQMSASEPNLTEESEKGGNHGS